MGVQYGGEASRAPARSLQQNAASLQTSDPAQGGEVASDCMEMTANRERSFSWPWILLLWATLGVFDATQSIISMHQAQMHHAWGKLFFVLIFKWLPWALLTPTVIQLARRYPPSWSSPTPWLVHVSAVIAIDVAAAAWGAALELSMQPWLPDFETHRFLVTWPMKIAGGLLPAIILYSIIVTITYALDAKARAAEQQTDTARLNEQLSYAKLNALQRQLEPHFIFNTLNAISGLVRERKNEAAVGMIVALSDFLRRVAGSSNEPRASLSQELEFLEKYLQIQEARFAGRLKLEMEIPDELRNAQVPSLVLQPLVENAIKHGIARRAQGGSVRVTASRTDAFQTEGMLCLSVYNDGPLLDDDGGLNHGIGLANLRTRLSLLYGKEFELRVGNYGITGVEVRVTLPYREA
jgi:two-component sensor histidine kinase